MRVSRVVALANRGEGLTLAPWLLFAALAWCIALPAHAQTCKESDSPATTADRFYTNCDMQYKETELMCDKKTVTASCPTQPMPMKSTEKKSLIKDFSPYLFAYARDPDDKSRPYTGTYYRGTKGNASQVFGLFGKPAAGAKRTNACVPQLQFPSSFKSVEEQAKMVRLELDNCTNQYILNGAISPLQKENATLLSNEDPANAAATISLATHCQPIKTVKTDKNEYFASEYIKAAWIKLLKDPTYRKNKKAKLEPHLPDGIKITNPIEPPANFPDVRLSMIGAIEYEEINDPSHPFSPRWDFEDNERDKYSPKTKDYGGDEKNGVFCAGDKTKTITKVDILSFREASLKFDDKIMKRIDFNKNCQKNTAGQAFPCCKVKRNGSLNPVNWTCKLQPCATCYKFSAAAPTCATDYITKPDRKKVSKKYLPVHPALRIAGYANMLSNMSLSTLNSLTGDKLNIGQALSVVSSPMKILSSVAGNSPLSAALPLLSGQANMMSALALTGLPTNAIQSALSGQMNLLSVLPVDLPIGNVQSLLSGQLNVMNAISSQLPLGDALSGVRAIQSALSLQPVTSALGDVTGLLNSQVRMANNLAKSITSVPQAISRMTLQIDQISAMGADISVSKAITMGLDATGLEEMGNRSVGEVQGLLRAQLNGVRDLVGITDMRQYTSQLSQQVSAIQSLSKSLPVGQVTSMLNSVQGTLGGVAGNLKGVDGLLKNVSLGGNLDQLRGALGTQLSSITGMAGDITNGQLSSLLGAQQGLLGSLGSGVNAMGLGDISKALNGQLAGLSSLSSSLPINQVTNMLSGQVGTLNNIVNSTTGQLTGAITSQFNAAINPIKSQLGSVSSEVRKQLNGITSGLTSQLNNVLGPITSQLNGALKGITSALPLKSLSGVLDSSLMGKIPGLNKIPGLPKMPSLELPYIVVKATMFPRTAKCNPNELGSANKPSMESLCSDLRAPFAPINKLRMRYHNPDDKSTITLTEGVAEGMSFKDYFKDTDTNNAAHMPYPRLWDTGRSIQKAASDKQDPMDVLGQYTSIVGVGHEGSPEETTTPPAPAAEATSRKDMAKEISKQDQRCNYGGWGDAPSMGGVKITTLPDPISSWTELKLYQTRTIRDFNLLCMGRYEKTFKVGSAENAILSALGGEVTMAYIERCNKDRSSCTMKTLAEDKKDGGTTPDGGHTITSTRTVDIPLLWRGYLSSTDEDQRFPKFGGSSGKTSKGLDDVQVGDIILLPKGGADSGDKPGLPKLGLVAEINLPGSSNCTGQKYCYVKVIEPDNGKWPDSCGTTDSWGEMKVRYLFKPGMLPKAAVDEYKRIGSTTDCVDTHLSYCEMKPWDDTEYYRIREDVISKSIPQ